MAVTFGPLDKVEFYCTFDIFQLTVVIGKPDRSCVVLRCLQPSILQMADVENWQEFKIAGR